MLWYRPRASALVMRSQTSRAASMSTGARCDVRDRGGAVGGWSEREACEPIGPDTDARLYVASGSERRPPIALETPGTSGADARRGPASIWCWVVSSIVGRVGLEGVIGSLLSRGHR